MIGRQPPRHIDVVMTTIGDATSFFDAYRRLPIDVERIEDVRFIVIPDQKTPSSFFTSCERARSEGLNVLSPTIDDQDSLLSRLGAKNLIPRNSDNRRNVGYLMSWINQSDMLISVDDDNFPNTDDFFEDHLSVLAGVQTYNCVSSLSGWWNACMQLEVTPMMVYPRGFPYAHRSPAPVSETNAKVDVRVNAGLWLGDPDVDAITRIGVGPSVTSLRVPEAVIAPGTWAPINSQNTAVQLEAIPAYYFPRMGYGNLGRRIDRYADIFSGYFLQACVSKMGHGVRFGSPVARHERNEHSLFSDLEQELPVIRVLDDLLGALQNMKLEGSTYVESYLSLSYLIQDAVEEFRGEPWTEEMRGFFHQMAHLMRQWLNVLDRSLDLSR